MRCAVPTPIDAETFDATRSRLSAWHHLLSGRQFIIETDHKILLYINDTAAPKVIR
jgi:hypothetical protein